MRFEKQLILALLFIIVVAKPTLAADAESFSTEAILIGGYSARDQWVGKTASLKNSIGFEYYRKFSNEYGDFLTLDLQVRTSYDPSERASKAFGVEIHNAWLEYKLGLGKALRVGHFDPAFGLEPVLDTHGTLLQTLAHKNIGFKKDWGIGYRDMLGGFDYQLALGLGSGMGIERRDGSYLFTGRISTPVRDEVQVGVSFLFGQTLMSKQMRTLPAPDLVSDKSVRKSRIGFDIQMPLGVFDFKAEAAAGTDGGEGVGGAMAELGYTWPEDQNMKLKLQAMYWSSDFDEARARDLTIAPVIEYKLNSSSTVRLGYFHDIYSRSGEDSMVVMQFYYLKTGGD